MRVRKHRVKHYNKIIKKYYLVDDWIRKIHLEIYTRRFPDSVLNHNYGKNYNNSKSKYKKKVRGSKFKQYYDYKNFQPYTVGIYVSVPVVNYNPNKRSRIKNVVDSFLMCSIDELNNQLGTKHTEQSIKNLEIIQLS